MLGWNDDRVAVYSRWLVLPSTCENLIRAITEPAFSGQPTQDGTEVVEELRSPGAGLGLKVITLTYKTHAPILKSCWEITLAYPEQPV